MLQAEVNPIRARFDGRVQLRPMARQDSSLPAYA
jgi:hypothetical protein